MTILDMPQGSPEWFQARAGLLTASVVSAIYAKGKGSDEAATRRDLRVKLALERITGVPLEEKFQGNADTQRGTDLEPAARIAYEIRTGTQVREVGLLRSDDLPIGSSSDGLVGDEGEVQFKCPRLAIHWQTVEAEAIPGDYTTQLVHSLLVSGRQWVDFASYCPQIPGTYGLYVLRYPRNEAVIAAHLAKVREFLAAVDATEAAFRRKMGLTR